MDGLILFDFYFGVGIEVFNWLFHEIYEILERIAGDYIFTCMLVPMM